MYESREHPVTAIAAVLGVSRATIYRELGNAPANSRPSPGSP